MRFYTDRRGRHRPITPRMWQRFAGYAQARPPKITKFLRKYPPPLPQNTIRQYFVMPDDIKTEIIRDVLSYAGNKTGIRVPEGMAAALAGLIPSTLSGPVQPVIRIEGSSRAVKGMVGVSVPVDFSKYPGGSVAGSVIGTPTFYANAECRVRVYKTKHRVQLLEARVGYSQQPAWAQEGVQVEWRKTLKPATPPKWPRRQACKAGPRAAEQGGFGGKATIRIITACE